MFIETSGECAMHFDWEVKCLTGAQMFKKSLQSLFCILPQSAFYSQSAVCILHSVCILPLVRSLRFTLTGLKRSYHGLMSDIIVTYLVTVDI